MSNKLTLKVPALSLLRALPALLVALSFSAATARAAAPAAVEAQHAMVVSAQRLASEIGVRILQAGGNAVDAAVAVGYAQAVTNPCCGNIGGGGFMIIHLAASREDIFVDFREKAPEAASSTMFLDSHGNPLNGASLDGYLAVAVPGTVLGLDTVLRKYGTLPRTSVMAPAIRLARDGFVLTQADVDILDAGLARLVKDPEARKVFLRKDGKPLRAGDRLRQPDLAKTLDAIARGGADAFYRGSIADKIVSAMRSNAGILKPHDLATYTISEGAPLSCSYRGYRILSAPPPSSGGTTLCEILNVVEGYDLKALGFHSATSVHLIVEALRHAFMDRNKYLGDPAFVINPIDRLLSKDYAVSLRKLIAEQPTAAPLSQSAPASHEKPETTHYSIVDERGNAVTVTYTINGLFGAGVMAAGTGFILNDEMDDFTVKPGVPNYFGLIQGAANEIAPGKRPLSSMTPTLVSKDGRIVMLIGSPGGSRIITVTLEVLLNMIDYGMSPQEAVDAPRIHQQWLPDDIFMEPFALSPDTIRLLQAQGYHVTEQAPWGAAELIVMPEASSNPRTRPDQIQGAHDPRRPAGAAIGY